MSDINSTIKELTARRAQAEQEIQALDGAILALSKIAGGKAPAKVSKVSKAVVVAVAKPKAKRKLSAAARARIIAAQKKRWAAFHAANKAKTDK